ncbi:MAG: hypothetical protein ACXAEN_23155 [Candidatus Thorarchaeota archaeon]|jgi:hypothetical protein
MDHTQIQQRYYEMLKEKYGTHKAVAKRLGITHNYYRRLRNQPDKYRPSIALYNSIITVVNNIRLETELINRS